MTSTLPFFGFPGPANLLETLERIRTLALETDRSLRVHALVFGLIARYRLLDLATPVLPGEIRRALLDLLHETGASEVRGTVETLRGGLLKVAQILSARRDLLPAAYGQALAPLQDRVPPRPWAEIESSLRRELGPRLEWIAHVDETPLAAASIAQVHRGRLRDGREVAIKVQYDGTPRLLRADLAALVRGARTLDRAFPESRQAPMAEEIAAHVVREVDFLQEADAATRMRAAFDGDVVPGVRVPAIVPELSTAGVLTMEFVDGERLSPHLERLRAAGDDAGLERILTLIVCAYAHQIARCGFFQSDPHPGNFLVEADGTLALIDFGCCKELPPERRQAFVSLGAALALGFESTMRNAFRAAGFETADAAAEERLLRVGRLVSRALQDPRAVEAPRPEAILHEMHANLGIHPPTDFALIGRVFLTLGGLLQTYAPRLNLFSILAPLVVAPAARS